MDPVDSKLGTVSFVSEITNKISNIIGQKVVTDKFMYGVHLGNTVIPKESFEEKLGDSQSDYTPYGGQVGSCLIDKLSKQYAYHRQSAYVTGGQYEVAKRINIRHFQRKNYNKWSTAVRLRLLKHCLGYETITSNANNVIKANFWNSGRYQCTNSSRKIEVEVKG